MIVTTTRPSGHPGYTETLPCTARSAATARRLVRTALAVWGMEHRADAATLIVSELVANAVDHTECRVIRVTVTRPAPGLIRIAVVDKCRTLPVPRTAVTDDERGRGLAVVEECAWRWGIDRLPWGKRVWGELRSGIDG
ncbi:ATP-binding protein [Streptomyces malaysiensis]|uniref:ATP-binding protein n=1 Tax=Streptomyces malaysiensis TaxID=92644 RepID=UPI002B30DF02|nr:ATP-binding protein [Streptomyces malaysiensis]